jgi:ribonuclease G
VLTSALAFLYLKYTEIKVRLSDLRTLYVNAVGTEKRVAVVENNRVVEVFMERPGEENPVGNIYIGRVTKVLPGMDAAFVDVGLDKQGYLHKSAIPGGEEKQIHELVHQGQAVVIQVVKEAIDTKGPKLTAKIEISGVYTVYLPHENMSAVSRNIQEQERKLALRELGNGMSGGFIFRSACENADLSIIEKEMKQLQALYKAICATNGSPPMLLHQAKSFLDRILHEIPLHTISHIVTDHIEMQQLIQTKTKSDITTLYRGKESLFSAYHIESEIEKALKKIVWLDNGAYILIEQTETMTVIDVNTGKFIGKGRQEDTNLQTNIYAAKEIARQLRLRDIGGMIAVDFINMKEKHHQEQVKQVLRDELLKDGAITKVFSFTALGILEMTRRRKRKSLRDYLLATCDCCKEGFVMSAQTAAYKLERELLQYRGSDYEAALVEANTHIQEVFQTLQSVLDVHFTTRMTHGFTIRHLGTKEEVLRLKNQ